MPRLRIIPLVLAFLALQGPAAARWADWPPGPTPSELEMIVRSAYTAAAAYARLNTNYFSRDDEFGPLHDAIAERLARDGHADVVVPSSPFADLQAASICTFETVELRYILNAFGDGITLTATSDLRTLSYHYDPHEDAAIVIKPAQACLER